MEFALMAKISTYIGYAIKGGYALVAGYFGATAVRYVKDYVESVEEDEIMERQ